MSNKHLMDLYQKSDSLKELIESPITSPIKLYDNINKEKLHDENIKYLIDYFSSWPKKHSISDPEIFNTKPIQIGNIKKGLSSKK